MQNPDAEHRTCTASQYTQLHEKHNAQYKKGKLTLVTLLNKIERIRRIVIAVTGERMFFESEESIES